MSIIWEKAMEFVFLSWISLPMILLIKGRCSLKMATTSAANYPDTTMQIMWTDCAWDARIHAKLVISLAYQNIRMVMKTIQMPHCGIWFTKVSIAKAALLGTSMMANVYIPVQAVIIPQLYLTLYQLLTQLNLLLSACPALPHVEPAWSNLISANPAHLL